MSSFKMTITIASNFTHTFVEWRTSSIHPWRGSLSRLQNTTRRSVGQGGSASVDTRCCGRPEVLIFEWESFHPPLSTLDFRTPNVTLVVRVLNLRTNRAQPLKLLPCLGHRKMSVVTLLPFPAQIRPYMAHLLQFPVLPVPIGRSIWNPFLSPPRMPIYGVIWHKLTQSCTRTRFPRTLGAIYAIPYRIFYIAHFSYVSTCCKKNHSFICPRCWYIPPANMQSSKYFVGKNKALASTLLHIQPELINELTLWLIYLFKAWHLADQQKNTCRYRKCDFLAILLL